MTIAFDAVSESLSPESGFTHTPVGTPKGVVVFYHASGTGSTPSTCTYGSASMTLLITQQRVEGETGEVTAFFLGSGIPTGAQTVTLNNGSGAPDWATCMTVTAAANTELAGDGYGGTQGLASPPGSVTIANIAGASFGFGGLYHGADSTLATAGSGMTVQASEDIGSKTCVDECSTTEQASGDMVVSFAHGSTDDYIVVGVAIQEVAAAAAFTPIVMTF